MPEKNHKDNRTHEQEYSDALKSVEEMTAKVLVGYLYSHETTLGDQIAEHVYQGNHSAHMNLSSTILNLADLIREIPTIVDIEKIKKEELGS